IGENAFNSFRSHKQSLTSALWKTSATEKIFDRQRALRHIRRVFEKTNVTCHQCWCGETQHLPEREVPRHHGEHRTDWLKAHEAFFCVSLHDNVRKMIVGIFRIVSTNPGALLSFANRSFDWFAHLRGH